MTCPYMACFRQGEMVSSLLKDGGGQLFKIKHRWILLDGVGTPDWSLALCTEHPHCAVDQYSQHVDVTVRYSHQLWQESNSYSEDSEDFKTSDFK